MATVTHGLQDGIDEILEKARVLERMLTARMATARESGDESKVAIVQAALDEVEHLRVKATSARAAIGNVNLSLRGR
jgi:hypothetical protein